MANKKATSTWRNVSVNVNVSVSVNVGWQVSNIGHQTSTHRSGTYHLLIKMSKLSHWHWLMTMETMEMEMEMETMEMEMSTTWHSHEILNSVRISCGRMPMLNAFFLSTLGTTSAQQHSTRIHYVLCMRVISFFRTAEQLFSQSDIQPTNHPSIHPSIHPSFHRFVSAESHSWNHHHHHHPWLSWFMASIEFWLTISPAFKVSVSRIRRYQLVVWLFLFLLFFSYLFWLVSSSFEFWDKWCSFAKWF